MHNQKVQGGGYFFLGLLFRFYTVKGDSRELQGYLKEVQRVFQGSFKEDSRVLKKVSSEFQENFIQSFKGVSGFVLQFCCSMNLIAATQAEGGLVSPSARVAAMSSMH